MNGLAKQLGQRRKLSSGSGLMRTRTRDEKKPAATQQAQIDDILLGDTLTEYISPPALLLAGVAQSSAIRFSTGPWRAPYLERYGVRSSSLLFCLSSARYSLRLLSQRSASHVSQPRRCCSHRLTLTLYSYKYLSISSELVATVPYERDSLLMCDDSGDPVVRSPGGVSVDRCQWQWCYYSVLLTSA